MIQNSNGAAVPSCTCYRCGAQRDPFGGVSRFERSGHQWPNATPHTNADSIHCSLCGTTVGSWIRGWNRVWKMNRVTCSEFRMDHVLVGCECSVCGESLHDLKPYRSFEPDRCSYCIREGCGFSPPHNWQWPSCRWCLGSGEYNALVDMAPRDPEGHGHEFDRYEKGPCTACDGTGREPDTQATCETCGANGPLK